MRNILNEAKINKWVKKGFWNISGRKKIFNRIPRIVYRITDRRMELYERFIIEEGEKE